MTRSHQNRHEPVYVGEKMWQLLPWQHFTYLKKFYYLSVKSRMEVSNFSDA